MIKNITVTNHLGDSVIIALRNPEQSGFFIRSIDGLGPPKATINMNQTPFDGDVYNSARTQGRNIVMNVGFYNDSALTIEEIRKRSYRYFPIKRRVSIVVETDTRTAMTVGYIESNEPNIFSKDEGAIISILCPDSYLVSQNLYETFFSGNTPLFEFPFENPSLTERLIEFGIVLLSTQQLVSYAGDAETGVIINVRFTGTVNNLSIYNVVLAQEMHIDSAKLIDLVGSDFQAGDILEISTVRGSKYIHLIRNGSIINILNALDIHTDWFTLETGDNLFYFTADSGVNNIQFSIQHRIVYEGI